MYNFKLEYNELILSNYEPVSEVLKYENIILKIDPFLNVSTCACKCLPQPLGKFELRTHDNSTLNFTDFDIFRDFCKSKLDLSNLPISLFEVENSTSITYDA